MMVLEYSCGRTGDPMRYYYDGNPGLFEVVRAGPVIMDDFAMVQDEYGGCKFVSISKLEPHSVGRVA